MGGCRCTYKNCTIRSDGKTHLFHYPVFDKVRCHEWLSKAGRYDFLSLKVSQLKNRCICQHHFTDDWFMNDKKDKLKSKAVPTLDGPFCDSSKFKDPEIPQNMLGVYPLACEVIENDDFILDRKSNYNLLYADFLTNSDVTEPLNILEDSKHLINMKNVTPIQDHYITEVHTHKSLNTDVSKPNKVNSKLKTDSIHETREIIIEVPPKEEIVEMPQLPLELSNPNVNKIVNLPNNQAKKSKVRIISEKKITEPQKRMYVPVSTASFEVVKPSMILNINKNKSKSKENAIFNQSNEAKENSTVFNKLENNMVNDTLMLSNNNKEEPIMLNNIVSNLCKEEDSNITEILCTNDPSKFEIKINLDEITAPTKVISNQKRVGGKYNSNKHKISPERVAAINEKRKFNMRLKDIIAEELSRLEGQSGADKDILPLQKKTALTKKSKESRSLEDKVESETVRSSLSKDPNLPNDNAYIIHYLEARMQKMENVLLNKIDQNTQKIMELKRTLHSKEDNQPVSKKTLTKTNMNDEAHKKQLYNEISKYLTPNCNSLIYEELFINKYDPNEINAPTPTKRKRNRR